MAWFSIAGLVLDVIGVWLVFWYGIPSRAGGAVGLLVKESDPRKAKRERLLGYLGLGCLTLGFLLQGVPSLCAIARG
jgi:hypothetical protein